MIRAASLIFISACAVLASSASAQSYDPQAQYNRNYGMPLVDARVVAPYSSPTRLEYGPRHWQEIHFFAPPDSVNAPLLVLFGSWSRVANNYSMLEWLRHRANEAGFAYAVIHYESRRPRPAFEMASYAEAIAYLRSQSAELAFDPDNIVIAGAGWNANPATLLGTNPAFLANADAPFAAVRGIMVINGGAFDLAARIGENRYLRRLYSRYFGSEPEEYLSFSPAAHLGAPDAPRFLFLANEDAEDAITNSQEFSEALSAQGIESEFHIFPDPSQGRLETYPLIEEDGSGREIIPFLQRAFSR